MRVKGEENSKKKGHRKEGNQHADNSDWIPPEPKCASGYKHRGMIPSTVRYIYLEQETKTLQSSGHTSTAKLGPTTWCGGQVHG
jgi:hypothetical protein